MVILDIGTEGDYVAVRPSGTEPKVKFYFFTSLSPADSADLARAKASLAERIKQCKSDIQAYAKSKTSR